MVIGRIACILFAAFILDSLLGDPQNPIHPIRLIGKLIGIGIKINKRLSKPNRLMQFICGTTLSIIVISIVFTSTYYMCILCYRVNFWLGLAIETILCYFLIAPKSLMDESMAVCHSITIDNLDSARTTLSMIVGRDTETLSQSDIIRAAVETVAENTSDGVIAPLIFICIGGAPLAMAYKTVNTLDSMIGYKNEEFMYFGKFAARLDDVVNYIPARITAFLMILGSVFTRTDTKGAIRVYKRDRQNHNSPNSAQTESVCAGALGISLGGDNYYKGKLVHKPTIGDDSVQPIPKHIIKANQLMYATASIVVVLLVIIGTICEYLWYSYV